MAVRVDSWTVAHDVHLVTTVLQHMASGRTQLEATEEVAAALDRTVYAVRFRWNGVIRHHFSRHIKEAKKGLFNPDTIQEELYSILNEVNGIIPEQHRRHKIMLSDVEVKALTGLLHKVDYSTGQYTDIIRLAIELTELKETI